ncbi:uncharacterized protein [Cicer arietinum]|uniref:Uncharacterized protein LOC101496033 n=1 Tax=Cicer arietinum TaxID=3827 RepID=A0A1S2XF90_CICAR|nr:uncharacterized protein LOC101496033 [Cicer arietinum]
MIGQFQILQTHQNDTAWSYCTTPYMPQNPALYSRRPPFNHPSHPASYPGRVIWNGDKQPDRRNDSSESSRFTGKVRRFHHPKRKFAGGGRHSAPFAPRNTTSFIIRAKKSGGIASLLSPCAVTPAILTTPTLSPSTEVVVEMAKEKWGVDGYGSMKGLIRLRSSEKENSDETGENNIGEHLDVEKRLNHDLGRFEMIYPSSGVENSLENRVDEQGLQIAHLEEQNLTIKERIFLMERELSDLRTRVTCLETVGDRQSENFNGGEVCSEKSVHNGDYHDGESDDYGDCV